MQLYDELGKLYKMFIVEGIKMKTNKGFFDNCSELFSMAENSKKAPGLITVLFISLWFMIFEILATMAVSIATYFIPGLQDFRATSMGELILGQFIPFILVIALVFWRVRYVEKRPVCTLGFPRKGAFKEYIRGLVIGIIMFLSYIAIMSLSGKFKVKADNSGDWSLQNYLYFIMLFVFWLVQGAKEEITDRGWMLPVLGLNYSYTFSIIATSIFFGVSHIGNPGITPLAVINTGLMGLFLALYSVFKGNIWGACGIHSAWNWVQSSIFDFSTSGFNGNFGVPVMFQMEGDHSKYGPEGEIVNTVILTTVLVIMLVVIKNRNRKLKGSLSVPDVS